MNRLFVVLFFGCFTYLFYSPQVLAGGVIDVNTGQFFPSAGGGVINPSNGTFHVDVGGGYVNTRTGQFSPKLGGNFNSPKPVTYGFSNDESYNPKTIKNLERKLKRKQNRIRNEIVLNPDIFNPQPKNPLTIAITGSGNYEEGISAFSSKDYEKAYFNLSRNSNYTSVKPLLGYMCLLGLGVERNEELAAKWYLEAAEKDHTVSQTMVALMYLNGIGLPSDVTEAKKWFLKAAEKEDEFAQRKLGDMYVLGQGVRPNKESAQEWYSKAAENGDDMAIKYLGLINNMSNCATLLREDLGMEKIQ